MNKKGKIIYLSIKLGICVIFATIIFILRDSAVENLRHFIGDLMLIYGLEEIVFEILLERKHFFHNEKLYLAFVEIILAFVLLLSNVSFESVCVIWATWAILRESYEIREVVGEIKAIVPRIVSGLESIIVIALSITLIITPGEHHAMTHMYLLLVEVILAPLIPLIDEIIIDYFRKKEKNNEQ